MKILPTRPYPLLFEVVRKYKRLQEMTAQEIAYRVREKVRIEGERVRFYLGSLRPGDGDLFLRRSLQFRFKHYLRGEPARRFYLPSEDSGRNRLRELIFEHFPQWVENAVEEAEKLCRHKAPLFGYGEIDLGAEIDWHRDPVTGRCWPRRFWADYDLVRDCSGGDPKTIHELNRHQHLPRLAKAYFLTGEERYAREAIDQMESWIEQNPPGLGVNWQSSLEIALRCISWLWTIFFLLPSNSLDETAARRIGESVFLQLDHVYHYPSIFSSPNTHLLGEASALFIAGLVFAELQRPAAWLRRGKELLIQEMKNQVLDEGVHAELSSYYHCYALDFYLQTLILARRNKFDFPPWIWRQACRMAEFLMHLTRPDGSLPSLGDDDGGRALALSSKDYRSFQDGLATSALLFQRPDFRYQAGQFSQETLWLLGEDAPGRYASLTSAAPSCSHAFYPEAGYFIRRSGWREQDSHLIFDCGGLGLITGGHGHADALSVILFAQGRELLADPGTFVYNCSPQWRNFFRSTRAHNTAVVDQQDQSIVGETFHWSKKANSTLLRRLSLPGLDYVEGEHDGYLRLPQGVIHRRRLLFAHPNYWLVFDDFRGQGTHQFDLYYHFAPQAELSGFSGGKGMSEIRLTAGHEQTALLLFCCASGPVQGEILQSSTDPPQGWVSGRYGVKEPAPVLRLSFSSATPALITSVLVPLEREEAKCVEGNAGWAVRRLQPGQGQAIVCSVEHSHFQDLAIFSMGGSEVAVGALKVQGEVFWVRKERGARKQVLAINACSFRENENVVFQNPAPLPHFSAGFDEDPYLTKTVSEGCK